MGMWQNLVAGYEEHVHQLETGFCICTMLKSIKSAGAILVRLNSESQLIGNIEMYDQVQEGIQLLATEESANRAGRQTKSSSHCLFDEIGYAARPGEKHDVYMDLLRKFCNSSKSIDIKVVLKYQERGTLWNEIQSRLLNKVSDKTIVLFSVERPGRLDSRLWMDKEIIMEWKDFALKERVRMGNVLDMITGRHMPRSINPGRKVNNMAGNAKLISANDSQNYTYRGMLIKPEDVLSIGYESTEKAHQFLRYLILSRGIRCDTQVLITWTINAEDNLPQPLISNDEFVFDEDQLSDSDTIELAAKTGINFAKALRQILISGRMNKAFINHPKTAVLMLDAATAGRMSVVFYRELNSEEYLERIIEWHESTSWMHQIVSRSEDKSGISKRHVYIGAPTVDAIINVVYGHQSLPNDDNYQKIKRKLRELIIRAIFDGQPLSRSFIERSLYRLSRPLSYIDSNDKYGKQRFVEDIAVFCSMLKQFYGKEKKIEMKIDLNCSDRSYLFGRLLGAADKLEEYALVKGDKDRMITAAIRYMQIFAQHPCTAWGTIHDQLHPYIQKVKGSIAFREIGDITELFSIDDFKNDKPLGGLYLLGYYQERNYIAEMAKKAKEHTNRENDQVTIEKE